MADSGINRTLQEGPERINGRWTAWGKYAQHRRDARGRGIDFLLTPNEWWLLWCKSGKWDQRGVHDGQYVMARHGDDGPYAMGNVKIIECGENHREGNIGKMRRHSEDHCRKISEAKRGSKLTEAHKRKIGESQKGIPKGPMASATKKKLSLVMTGKKTPPRSKLTRQRLKDSTTKYWSSEKGLARRGLNGPN